MGGQLGRNCDPTPDSRFARQSDQMEEDGEIVASPCQLRRSLGLIRRNPRDARIPETASVAQSFASTTASPEASEGTSSVSGLACRSNLGRFCLQHFGQRSEREDKPRLRHPRIKATLRKPLDRSRRLKLPKHARRLAAPLAALSRSVPNPTDAVRAPNGRFRPARRGGHFEWRQRQE